MFLKSLSKKEKESLLCFKEIYLSRRGQTENFNRELIRSEMDKEMKVIFPNFSSQIIEDLVDVGMNFAEDKAICHTVGDVSCLRIKTLFNNLLSYFVLCQYLSSN